MKQWISGLFILTICAVLLNMAPASAALAPVTVDGQLTGATGVEYLDLSWDVEFVDGTANSLFKDSNGHWDFAFTTASEAINATNALNQVFDHTNSLFVDFDDSPELVNGITSTDTGIIVIPFSKPSDSDFLHSAQFHNYEGDSSAFEIGYNIDDNAASGLSFLSPDWDSGSDGNYVYARWTRSPAPIPEPATVLLFGVGLLGFAGISRKKIN